MRLIYRMVRRRCRSVRIMFQKLFPFRIKVETLRGGWNDSDIQILHANFQILVNYVEKECAWMDVVFSSEEWNVLPWTQRVYLMCGGTLRSRPHGTKYLQWEQNLLNEDGTASNQASISKQIYDLYWWWTVVRPLRVDPYSKITAKYDPAWWRQDGSLAEEQKEQHDLWSKQADEANALEEQYYQEDTDHLKKLMDLRNCMWT
jgi:hypothetical protein